ncbi:tRNA(Ile)-lysidine synthetase [Orientia chuto str. Dubai]|uniref:tRNA(Ile)-lysidine synthase n=1 Tax=Orientia chuto str. Dubai TaxID=1359168 RepID=A0A0F3MKD3_9RICK|nr:tRNA lysidine(34) synthetase TilS [Candidatus Orientia mediorientalis]KJV55937.1 tRNA(Ile)-lysidine synthetase [Orientia chuto str. Dubai]
MNIELAFCHNMDFFGPFEKTPKLAIAVSGGSDSLALILLVKHWNQKVKGQVTVLTVDHRLRSESASEANYVSKICKDIKLKHVTLNWIHQEITGNIQAQARKARYQLLTKYCQEHDILHLVTGHHVDDIVENFFIRLFRGSGLAGLSSHNIFFVNNIRIIRPLFNITKLDLQRYLKRQSIQWINDPSNSSNKYLRTKVRSLLKSEFISFQHDFTEELLKKRIILSQEHLNRALESINNEIIYYVVHAIKIYPAGFAVINRLVFRKASNEARYAILAYLLMIVGTTEKPPRFISLQDLILKDIHESYTNKTLHGCVIEYSLQYIIIYREFGRYYPKPQPVINSVIWDCRFKVIDNRNDSNMNLIIDYLKQKDYLLIKQYVKNNQESVYFKYSKKILFTFPVVKYLEKVIAIPHIQYYSNKTFEKSVSFIFEPQLVSRWFHYC